MTAPPSAAPGAASAHTRPFNVEATSKYCDGGQTCPLPKECCPQGCCALYPPSGARPPPPAPPAPPPVLALVFWNNWYLWLMLVLALASCAGGCGLYRRRRHAPGACCGAAGAHLGHPHAHAHPHPLPHARAGSGASERSGSPGSCCAPPHYSRCASLHLAPPPYTEVTAKPDLYPLVFGYADGAAPGKGVPGAAGAATGAGSYLMVQYFRNYIVRPIGSLSGASTVDSLSSGFLCSAANEANSMVPPPYSCTGSLDEFGLSSVATGASGPVAQTPLPGSGSCAGASAGAGGGGSQRFVSAAALSAATGSEASSLAGAGAASPPRATSPTLELRSLLGRISRAYLPLPPAPPPPPRRWLSRSAPATPCSALLPPLPSAGAGPGGGAAVADGCSPLLAGDADDDEEDEDDDDEGACRRLQRPV